MTLTVLGIRSNRFTKMLNLAPDFSLFIHSKPAAIVVTAVIHVNIRHIFVVFVLIIPMFTNVRKFMLYSG